MAVYLYAELQITNMDGIQPYIVGVPSTIAEHGGRYVARSGNSEVIEGSVGDYPVKVIIQFPSMTAAKGWYNSKGYQELLPFRQNNSKSNLIWMEGE